MKFAFVEIARSVPKHALQQLTPVYMTSLRITINNLKYKRYILLRRAHSHVAINLIDGYKLLICSTEVLVVQRRDVPFWTTPQWRTLDFAFLHLLLSRLGTERYSTFISDRVSNCPCRHTIILPLSPTRTQLSHV